MAKSTRAYGIGSPLQEVFPKPIVAQRAPTAADVGYEIGQSWVDNSADASYVLTSVAGGSATWSSTANPAINQAGLQSFDGSGTLNGRTITAGSPLMTVTNGDGVSGNPTVAPSSLSQQISGNVVNIGFSHSGTTLTVHSADGTALSASNPGYVTFASDTVGQVVTVAVTSNQTLTDGSSGSLTGQRFGVTTGVDWSNAMPFNLYAVLNNSEDSVVFGITRNPCSLKSPGTTWIGKSGSSVNVGHRDWFLMGDPTVDDYDSNPCVFIGQFSMTFTGSSDYWTVSDVEGVGRFYRGQWVMPAGQNGAAAGTYVIANAGTEPVFSGNTARYFIDTNGFVTIKYLFQNVTTPGVGANSVKFALPAGQLGTGVGGVGLLIDASAGNTGYVLTTYTNAGNEFGGFYKDGASFLVNTDFDTNDDLTLTYRYESFRSQ